MISKEVCVILASRAREMSLARLCKRIFGGSPSIWNEGARVRTTVRVSEDSERHCSSRASEAEERVGALSSRRTSLTSGCETQDASCIARAAPSWLPLGDTPLVQSRQQQHLSEVTTPLREGARRFFRVHFGPHKTSCLKCTGVGTQLAGSWIAAVAYELR